jgi:hypothetical protein
MGGRPGAGLARWLLLPVSNDRLLRVVRRRASLRTEPLAVIGIDDWAELAKGSNGKAVGMPAKGYRRNHRYGTIVCDLERRRVVALLPDREQATSEVWLRQHPEISVVSGDRGSGYGEAVARALPQAIHVADRWHPMENVSATFLDAVRLSMHAVRAQSDSERSNLVKELDSLICYRVRGRNRPFRTKAWFESAFAFPRLVVPETPVSCVRVSPMGRSRYPAPQH